MSRTLVASSCLALLAAAAASAAPAAKIIAIDCSHGQRIQQALAHPAESLILEISGLCREKVVIERPNVTLRGSDPALDGISGPVGLDPSNDNDRAMITVRKGVKEVRFESLAITGSESRGLEVVENAWVELDGCHVAENAGRGLQVAEGNAELKDTLISDNGGYQLVAWSGASSIFCTRCTISDDSGYGVVAVAGGRVFLSDSKVSIDRPIAVVASEAGHIWATDSSATGRWSLYADDGGQISWYGGELDGGIALDTSGQIFLENAVQVANPIVNDVWDHSYLRLWGGQLVGETHLQDFSTGSARDYFGSGAPTLGDLSCDSGADFFCGPGVTKSSSSCGQCP